MKPWLQTFTGLAVDLLDPRSEQIAIEDIAHALAAINRFAGHTRAPYSVAEHSVRASLTAAGGRLARAMLLHDASEAYLVDIPAPLKPHLVGYGALESQFQAVIAERFGIPPSDFGGDLVKHLDRIMLATEKRDLMGPEPRSWGYLPDPLPEKIEPWTPTQAEQRFLLRFRELFT